MKIMKRKKNFSGLVALVMLISLTLCSGAWAVLLRYDENDQQWRDLEVQRVPWRSGTDPDNDYYGTNCFALIKWIVEIEGRGTINSYTNSGRVLDSFTGGVLVAQWLNDQKNAYPTAETVKADFTKAHLGDVVQMRWKYSSSTQHTAMINGFDDNGVYFFQSHVSGYGVKKIKNSYYSYADLAQRYSNAGSAGGYSIYYFASPAPDTARDKAVAHAYEMLNYEWNTNDYVILYNSDFGPFVNNGVLTFSNTPHVAKGSVRGIPYSLSKNGGGGDEKTFSDYKALSISAKMQKSKRYWYGSSYKVSMRYGMSCATFVTDCILQGIPNKGLYVYPVTNFHRQSVWSNYVTMGSLNDSGYNALQKGDYLYHQDGNHVRLVVENNRTAKTITYIDQTPPDGTVNNCTNKQDVYISFSTYDGSATFTGWAKKVCMQCDACKRSTMGTHIATISYSALPLYPAYYPMYVDYPDDPDPKPEGIPIDAEHFPDSYFREYVKNFDTNGNGYFSQSELDAVTEMWEENGPHPDNGNPSNGNYGYEWIKIESIEGIKYFRNLKKLCVYRDNIKEIDLSGMEHLEMLYCYGNTKNEGYGNKLTKLILKNCHSLQELRCSYNQIKTLDLEGCTALQYLDAVNNQLETLNLKGCKSLYWLLATNNKLTGINVDGCTSLLYVYLGKNSFKELKLSGMSSVIYITAHKNPALKCVYVNNNPTLQTLVLNDCPALERIYAGNSGNIRGIDINGDTNLRIFERAKNVTVPGSKPTITTSSLPDAVVGEIYNVKVSAKSNALTCFSVNAVVMSNGISFDISKYYSPYNDVVSAPLYGRVQKFQTTYPRNITVIVAAQNYVGKTTKSFTLTIKEDTSKYVPKITSSAISGKYYTGTYYDIPLTASGASPITWEISSGTLPPGLILNKDTGRITGRISSTAETREASTGGNFGKAYTFGITAKNSYGSSAAQTNKPVVIEHLRITTESLASGTRGEAYTSKIECIGSMSYLIDWKIVSGRLPDGLSFSSSGFRWGNEISGTPKESGTFPITVRAYDAVHLNHDDRQFDIVIKEKPIVINWTFRNGYLNAEYSDWVSVGKGTSPYTWQLVEGSLPEGTKLSYSETDTRCYLKGTPTARGTYNFKLKATDKNGASATKSFTVKITGPDTYYTFMNGYLNVSYSDWIRITGDGTAPYTVTLHSGNIPEGTELTCSETKVTLSGKPKAAGSYTFQLKVRDKYGANVIRKFTVNVTQLTLTGSLNSGALKNPYKGTLKLSGGRAPYTVKLESGTLPEGTNIKLSGTTVTISGTPTKAAKYTFKLRVTDKNGSSVIKSYTVNITQPSFSKSLPSSMAKSSSVYIEIPITGGTPPYSVKLSKGKLPDGLKYAVIGSKIVISGIPKKTGKYSFTFTVTDKNKVSFSKTFTATITLPSITGTLSEGVINSPYSSALKASGGTAAYKWTISKGKLPDGLTLNKSTGKISGKPTRAGKFSFVVKITDKNKLTASKTYTLTIKSAAVTSVKTSEKPTEFPVEVHRVMLHVLSEDVLSQGEGRDEDFVIVRENEPLSFIIDDWPQEVYDECVYVDDKPAYDIDISEEGIFTLPAEIIHNDIKVSVKARAGKYELESQELYISAE